MAFNCRVFGYEGVQQIPTVRPKQFSADSVMQMIEPATFSQVISVSAVAASSTADVDTRTNCIVLEVPDGEAVRYVVNPPGSSAVADTNARKLSGVQVLFFKPGWTISLIDAAGLP